MERVVGAGGQPETSYTFEYYRTVWSSYESRKRETYRPRDPKRHLNSALNTGVNTVYWESSMEENFTNFVNL